MSIRLLVAIISTVLEEAALVAVVLIGLPRLGIEVHLAVLIALMVVWSVASVALYRVGSRALRRKPFITLPDMIDGRGRVVSPLDPEGLVRVKGELWVATSAGKKMDVGTNIIVVAQNGLKIVVRERKTLGPEKPR